MNVFHTFTLLTISSIPSEAPLPVPRHRDDSSELARQMPRQSLGIQTAREKAVNSARVRVFTPQCN